MKKTLLWLAAAGLACGIAGAQDLARKAPPEVDNALRQRVSGFYEAFKAAQYREAEKFVVEESRDVFYTAKKNRILSFTIQNVEFSEDFKEAAVLVASQTVVPMMGSAPLTVPLSSNWRWAAGDWHMFLAQSKTPEATDTPFGSMKFENNSPGGMPFPTERPTLASLKNLFKVSDESVTFSSQGSGAQTKTVTVTNLAAGSLSVEPRSRAMPGLNISIAPETVAAKGEAKISFTYNPAEGEITGKHRFDFMVMPINQQFSVFLGF